MRKNTDIAIKKELEKVGKRMQEIRKKTHTNYEQFAYTHNINRAQYGRYENGGDMTLSSLLKVLKAFDMTLTEFFAEGFDDELEKK